MTVKSNEICIRLIGDVLVATDDPDYRWLGETFHRLLTEVKQIGEVARLMRYSSHHVQFVGVEVGKRFITEQQRNRVTKG